MQEKLASLEKKIIVGGENLLEKAELQAKLLEESERELEKRLQREAELKKRLDEREVCYAKPLFYLMHIQTLDSLFN